MATVRNVFFKTYSKPTGLRCNSSVIYNLTISSLKYSWFTTLKAMDDITSEEKNDEMHDVMAPKNVYKKGRRPNFFLAIQIDKVEIHEKLKKLQEQIIDKNPILHEALVHIPTLHITLAVMHLGDENDLKVIKEKLDDWDSKNKKEFFSEPMTLHFKGLGIFSNSVAFVDLSECKNYQRLCALCKNLNQMLSLSGFLTSNKPIKPHLTILKLSKSRKLLKRRNRFKNDLKVLKNIDDYFGEQEVHSIQLLSMNHKEFENGYYKCYHEINVSLNPESLEMNHSEGSQLILIPMTDND